MAGPVSEVDGQIEIAVVRKPVGLGGWCALSAHGETLGSMAFPCNVTVGAAGTSRAAAIIEEVRRTPKGYQCRFAGCSSIECAEAFRAKSVFIDRAKLPSLDEANFYHFELEGMTVVSSQDGRELGTVRGVENYPSVDALDIALGRGGSVLVPMNGGCVRRVDKEKKVIIIDECMLDEVMFNNL